MSNSHPVVLLRQKVEYEEGELDDIESRVVGLEKCVHIQLKKIPMFQGS